MIMIMMIINTIDAFVISVNGLEQTLIVCMAVKTTLFVEIVMERNF